MLILIVLVLMTFCICGYDIVKISKMHCYNAKSDGFVMKQNHCTEKDYEFFDKRK